jgi:environmental stress-induced protein Ves
MAKIIPLSPADYVAFPWKNGRGVTTDIAARYRPDAKTRDWSDMLWRFGRTPMPESGPYSDLTGFERLQVLIAGDGFTIRTEDGAVHRDLSRAFVPVRYDGGTKLSGRLNGGPVETVNFLYRRDAFEGDLLAPEPGVELALGPGTHVIHAPEGAAAIELDGIAHALADRHSLRVEGAANFALRAGRALIATVTSRGTPNPASDRSG